MSVTPLRKQYLRVKQRYPEAIVFFRLGDFYETFDDDARTTSRELEIVLTSREMGKGVKVPLAGIPYHALENYLSKLISRGYKVAICEQLTAPGNGLVERDVIRVVTPGTVIEPGMLTDKSNNYLVSVVTKKGQAGVAYVDITTGEFAATQIPVELAADEIGRLNPAELIIPASGDFDAGSFRNVSKVDDYHYERDVAEKVLLDIFGRLAGGLRMCRAAPGCQRCGVHRRISEREPESRSGPAHASRNLFHSVVYDAGFAHQPQPGALQQRSLGNGAGFAFVGHRPHQDVHGRAPVKTLPGPAPA